MSLRDDLIREEGTHLVVYDDATGHPIGPGSVLLGHPTIGTGRALDTNGLSDAEVLLLLDNDIKRTEDDLDRGLPWWRSHPEWVQRGMANVCFQLGLRGLLGFHDGLAALQAKDYLAARAAFLNSLWAKQTPARAARIAALFSATDPGSQQGAQNV